MTIHTNERKNDLFYLKFECIYFWNHDSSIFKLRNATKKKTPLLNGICSYSNQLNTWSAFCNINLTFSEERLIYCCCFLRLLIEVNVVKFVFQLWIFKRCKVIINIVECGIYEVLIAFEWGSTISEFGVSCHMLCWF